MAARVLLVFVALGGAAIGVAWGWGALGVYAFFVLIPLVSSLALGVGADWMTKTSRGRFADRPRR